LEFRFSATLERRATMAATVVRRHTFALSSAPLPSVLFLSFLGNLSISFLTQHSHDSSSSRTSFSSSSSSSSISSSCTSSSSSSSSILHRSGKDPPRVALHERVVDEESVKLALRQHYPAGYRYLGRLVISPRVRPTF
jgi:hypothetical protein